MRVRVAVVLRSDRGSQHPATGQRTASSVVAVAFRGSRGSQLHACWTRVPGPARWRSSSGATKDRNAHAGSPGGTAQWWRLSSGWPRIATSPRTWDTPRYLRVAVVLSCGWHRNVVNPGSTVRPALPRSRIATSPGPGQPRSTLRWWSPRRVTEDRNEFLTLHQLWHSWRCGCPPRRPRIATCCTQRAPSFTATWRSSYWGARGSQPRSAHASEGRARLWRSSSGTTAIASSPLGSRRAAGMWRSSSGAMEGRNSDAASNCDGPSPTLSSVVAALGGASEDHNDQEAPHWALPAGAAEAIQGDGGSQHGQAG